MSRCLPPLNALKHFEASARLLSFKRAAEELCVSHGAVSKQIKMLETHFGFPLFDRDTRNVRLTAAGRNLFPRILRAFDELDLACASIRKPNDSSINVSVMPSVAIRWLLPRFVKFNTENPHLTIRWVNSVTIPDFDHDDIDIAIRSGTFASTDQDDFLSTIDPTMVGGYDSVDSIYLMSEQPVPVCSPAFLASHGPFDDPDQFLSDYLVHMARRPNAWHDWLSKLGSDMPPSCEGREYGHFFLAIEAAVHNAGIALVPYVLVHNEIEEGKLVLVGDELLRSSASFYLFISKNLRRTAYIQQFIDWIVSQSRASDYRTKRDLMSRYSLGIARYTPNEHKFPVSKALETDGA